MGGYHRLVAGNHASALKNAGHRMSSLFDAVLTSTITQGKEQSERVRERGARGNGGGGGEGGRVGAWVADTITLVSRGTRRNDSRQYSDRPPVKPTPGRLTLEFVYTSSDTLFRA